MSTLTFVCFLLSLLSAARPGECPLEATATAARGHLGQPPLLPDDLADHPHIFGTAATACTPTSDIYRSYISAISTADHSQPAGPNCQLPGDCKGTKVNSVQAASCHELLLVRDELVGEAGYTALCRHDLTDWAMKPAETYGCQADGVCWSSDKPHFVQRQLSPTGLRRAAVVGEGLHAAGVVVNGLFSSPHERCKKSARQMGAAFNLTHVTEKAGELCYTAQYKEYQRHFNFTSLPDHGKSDVQKIVATRCRQWLQEPVPHGNRLAVSHGYTFTAAVGYSFDEGDCGWLKPTDSTYGLLGPLDVELSNYTFKRVMDANTRRVGLLAVLSPEQTQKMGQCTQLRAELASLPEDQESFLFADANHDLVITQDEFESFCENRRCSAKTSKMWNIIVSLQARPYWKADDASRDGAFHIGEHGYWNGGWIEKKYSKGGWAFPWRRTTLDTIRPGVSQMKQVLAPVDYLLANLTYKEAKRVHKCVPEEAVLKVFRACTLLSFDPVPTLGPDTDSEVKSSETTRDGPVAGQMYPYPPRVYIKAVRNPILVLAMCLVQEGHVAAGEMAGMMGCSVELGEGKKKKKKGKKNKKKDKS